MEKDNKAFLPLEELNEEELGNVRENAVENGRLIKQAFEGSFDIVTKKGYCGGKCVVFADCDGLCNTQKMADNAIKPMLTFNGELPEESPLDYICDKILCGTEQKKETSLDNAVKELLRGNLIIFVEGQKSCIIFGVQNIPERSLEEPDNEVQEFGSREAFTENMKTNLTLVRKRLCTTNFKIEMQEVGKTGKTRILLCYMDKRVNPDTLKEVKNRLSSLELDTVLASGYLRKALDTKSRSFFTMIGQTQRPDTFAAKICEGKIGIIVDGTPFALVVPKLFIENFHTLDDYINRPYFAVFMRGVRFLAFLISVFLPGIFVAIGLFHQEIISDDMLYNIVLMESNTLFTLTLEALIIHFVYEIVREAGLRMPKNIGHAVSIVGALVIGDAAVTAGLIGAPMLIIVAMTAICSLVSSDLYQPISVLRIIFIIVGGYTGLYGIMIGAAALAVGLAAMTDYGVPFLAPAAPYNKALWRDSLFRANIEKLGKKVFDINGLKVKAKKGDKNG